jgi:hypothetical protein
MVGGIYHRESVLGQNIMMAGVCGTGGCLPHGSQEEENDREEAGVKLYASKIPSDLLPEIRHHLPLFLP